MFFRKILPIAVMLAAWLPAASQADTHMGGADTIDPAYGPVPVNSTGVVAAANFAATTKSVTIKTILTARQAATANLHFIICMRVAGGGKTYLAETRVSRAAGKPYSLDAWNKVKSCK